MNISGSWEQCLEWVKTVKPILLFNQYSEQRHGVPFNRQSCILDFALLYVRYQQRYLYRDYQSLQGKRLGMIKGNYLNLCFDKFVE
ncbi:MAG: hypothetical protein ACLRXQ_02050 [Phascolarctobacterium faecium]